MKIKRKLNLLKVGLIISLSFFDVELYGQQQIDPEYISIPGGLASPTANDVLQDHYGLIWIGTANGLQKYNGYTFETFKHIPGKATSLQDNQIWNVFEDTNNDIWVGNGKGVSRFDRQKNEFKNYEFATTFKSASPKVDGFKLFKDSKERLWALTIGLSLLQYDEDLDEWKLAKYDVSVNDELENNRFALSITEDSKGGIWLGSASHGLMYLKAGEDTFKTIAIEEAGDIDFTARADGLPGNIITALYIDSSNTMWITTITGIYKYSPETGSFKTIREYIDLPEIIWTGWNKILSDPEGNIWIANNLRGILKFEGITDQFEEIELKGKLRVNNAIWNITMTQFTIDRSGIFWFGSREYGLLKYDPINRPFSFFEHDESNPNSLSPNGVFGILASQVKPGRMYVGTRGNGVNIYDPKKKSFDKVRLKAVNDMFGGSVRSIYEDKDGTLWLGTWGDGLVELDENNEEINRYQYDSLNNGTLSNNNVRVIKKDNQERLWIGTNGGLNILDLKTRTTQRVASKLAIKYSPLLIADFERLMTTDQKIGSIEQVIDNQDLSVTVKIETPGTYWVMGVGEATANRVSDFGWIENANKDTIWQMADYANSFHAGGAFKNRVDIKSIDLKRGSYTIHYKSDDSHNYGEWNAAAPDQTSLYGIVLYKPQDVAQFQSYEPTLVPEKTNLVIGGTDINDIEITDNFIWVASSGVGLDRIDPVTNIVKHYESDLEDPNSLSSNYIYDIHEDKQGILWIATDEGINLFDPIRQTFTRYSEADGLPTNLTQAIVEGDDGEMWIATENGLSQMVTNENLGKVTFINYNSSDGLGGDSFVFLGSARAADGQYYFGGDHGLTTFKAINSNKTPPDVIISNLFISNKSVLDMKENSPLTESLLDTKSISLSFDQNNLGFEFSALHYANPQKNQYAHRLKGYDKEWVYNNRNFAGYTNLASGEYKFMVRASNAYGIWNEEGRSITITILPPWWRTWWAYTLYIVLFFVLAYATYSSIQRSISMRERERNRERELKQAKEIEKAYTQLKSTQSQLIHAEKMASLGELTAGIAHEIQNPLNFVNNFSELSGELTQELKEELEKGDIDEAKAISNDLTSNLEKINYHGNRASDIVKSMLQHSRTGNGEKELTDINSLADEYVRLSYHGLRAKDKSFNAQFNLNLDETVPKIHLIPQDIGRVLLNLVNNAFHATAEKMKSGEADYKPTVEIFTKYEKSHIDIIIQDNGSGIPDDIKAKIFQPFFTTKAAGTGLGLSMSYDIVTKGHGGTLEANSEKGKGTSFIITLPIKLQK